MKLLMVGFDGLEPSMITNFPTFSQFRDKLHLLLSVPSTMTQEAWGAMYTGRLPFEINLVALPRDPDRVSTLKGIGAQTIFDALGDAGLRIGCIGMPMTFPVNKIDDFMVGGFPLTASQYRADEEYFYPPDIKEIIESTYYAYLWANEEVTPLKEAVTYDAIENSIQKEKEKVTCASQIMTKLDCYDLNFLAIGFSFTDIAAHCRRVYPISRTYQAADEILQKILETFEFDNLLIVSDHGLGMVPWRGKPFKGYSGIGHRRYGICICVGKDIEIALKQIKIRRWSKSWILQFVQKLRRTWQSEEKKKSFDPQNSIDVTNRHKTQRRSRSRMLKFARKLKRTWRYKEHLGVFNLHNSIDITDVYALIAQVFGLPKTSKFVKQESKYSEDELQSIKSQLELLGYM